MIDIGNEVIQEETGKIASQVEAEINVALDTAKALAAGLSGMREVTELDRDAITLMLRKTLEDHPQFYAIWSAWEPNAFDGKDEQFRMTEGTDETGRFISYWLRDGNQLTLHALENYDVPGDGDYYLLARNSGQDIVLEPYEYIVNGQKVLLTSLVSPIKVNGQVVGAVGVDITLDHLQNIMSEVKLYDTGFAFIVSEQGTVVTNPHEENIGQNLTTTAACRPVGIGRCGWNTISNRI